MVSRFNVQEDNASLQSARNFRKLMDAMARPGECLKCKPDVIGAGALNPVAALLAETLIDHETPVWLGPDLDTVDTREHLLFHCACPLTQSREEAVFAFVDGQQPARELDGFAAGTPAYPDASTTIVLQVEAVWPDGPLELSGPGIKHKRRLGVTGLAEDFGEWWFRNVGRFPLGNDIFLASEDAIAAMPRSIKMLEIA